MKLLTSEQQKSYENVEICYMRKGKLECEHAKDKKHHKPGIIVMIEVNIGVLHIAYVI